MSNSYWEYHYYHEKYNPWIMHIILFVLFGIICFDVFIISSVYRFIWFIHPSGLLYCNMITLVPVDVITILQWRHNERIGVSNHQPHDCLLNRLFRHRSKKTSKLCVTGLCTGNSPVTGEFPARRASNAENISIWWRHHDMGKIYQRQYTTKQNNVWTICMILEMRCL